MNENTELVRKTAAVELVAVYRQSSQEIREAFDKITIAQSRLRTAFLAHQGWDFDLRPNGSGTVRFDDPDASIKELKRDAWAMLIERLEIRSILSVAKRHDLDKQIMNGEGLPEITEENIIGWVQGTVANIPEMFKEACVEVFNWLRPHYSGYKTNKNFAGELGSKVIIGYGCDSTYSQTHPFRAAYRRDPEFTALDNVMLMLDGKGTVKTYNGAIHDAISSAGPDGKGETDYFKIRCYQNGNVHMEFKRLDLLAKLNGMVDGGHSLKPVK